MRERHLAGWSGILQADAYSGYNRLYALEVVIYMAWRGLRERPLVLTPANSSLGRPISSDELLRTCTAPWAELRDRYFDALKRVAVPFFDAFPRPRGRRQRLG